MLGRDPPEGFVYKRGWTERRRQGKKRGAGRAAEAAAAASRAEPRCGRTLRNCSSLLTHRREIKHRFHCWSNNSSSGSRRRTDLVTPRFFLFNQEWWKERGDRCPLILHPHFFFLQNATCFPVSAVRCAPSERDRLQDSLGCFFLLIYFLLLTALQLRPVASTFWARCLRGGDGLAFFPLHPGNR